MIASTTSSGVWFDVSSQSPSRGVSVAKTACSSSIDQSP